MADNFRITQQFVDEFNRLRAKVDQMTGPGLDNSPTSISHATDAQPHQVGDGLELTRIIIDGPTADAGRYRYLGKIYYGGLSNQPTDLSTSDLGTASTNQVEIWNFAEIGGRYVSPLLVAGDIVDAHLGGYNKLTGKPIFVASAVPSVIGQYVGMGTFTVVTGSIGADWPRATPMLP